MVGNNQNAATMKMYSLPLPSFQSGRNNAQPKCSKASLALQLKRPISSAGKGNENSLKLLELYMDLLQLRTWPRFFYFLFFFFFNALADGKYALSTDKLLVFEGNGCLQC